MNEKVHSALADADCVGLFPEGLCAEGDKLLKFHSALFESAVANRARVHPAALAIATLLGLETAGSRRRTAAGPAASPR